MSHDEQKAAYGFFCISHTDPALSIYLI